MIRRFTEIVIVSIPVAVFMFLVVQEIVPTGVFRFSFAAGDRSAFADGLVPKSRQDGVRVDAYGDTIARVVGDPVFFFVHPHREFKRVEMDVWFKNSGVPIVELGGLSQTSPEVYDIHPLQNMRIDESQWAKIAENGTVLLQREKRFDSIAAFLDAKIAREEIATYQFNGLAPFRTDDQATWSTPRTTRVSLRGSHELKTYVRDAQMAWTFTYTDLNRDEGADPMTLFVTNERGEPVASARTDDDGDVTDHALPSALRTLRLTTGVLPEGVYKIALQASRDIMVRSYETTQRKIVFLNAVFLGDEVGFRAVSSPVHVWTDGKRLAFQTRHSSAVQTVRVGGESVDVKAPYVRYEQDVKESAVVEVVSPLGDLEMLTDGTIAFDQDQFWQPDAVRLFGHTDLDARGINYIIANYTPPRSEGAEGAWRVAHLSFDASRLLLDQRSWKFVFSVPGAYQNTPFDFGRIDFTLLR